MRINIDQLITTQDFTDSGTEEAIIGLYAYLLNNGIPKEDSVPWISRLMTVLKNEYKDVSEPKGTKPCSVNEIKPTTRDVDKLKYYREQAKFHIDVIDTLYNTLVDSCGKFWCKPPTFEIPDEYK